MTPLVYNETKRNNYDHFLDLLDQTHVNRYLDFNISFEYKKLAEQMLSDCEFMDSCSLEEKQKLFNEIKIKHLYQGQVLYSMLGFRVWACIHSYIFIRTSVFRLLPF